MYVSVYVSVSDSPAICMHADALTQTPQARVAGGGERHGGGRAHGGGRIQREQLGERQRQPRPLLAGWVGQLV